MIAAAAAKAQAKRLRSLKYAADNADLLNEYMRLLEGAVSERHAQRVVDEIIIKHIDAIAPSQLRDYLESTGVPAPTKIRPDCDQCGGTGFIRCVTYSEGGTAYDAVRRCRGCHPSHTKPQEDTEARWAHERSAYRG